MTSILIAIILGVLALLGVVGFFVYGMARAEKEHRDKHDGGMM